MESPTEFIIASGFDYSQSYNINKNEIESIVNECKQDNRVIRIMVWSKGKEPYINIVRRLGGDWEPFMLIRNVVFHDLRVHVELREEVNQDEHCQKVADALSRENLRNEIEKAVKTVLEKRWPGPVHETNPPAKIYVELT